VRGRVDSFDLPCLLAWRTDGRYSKEVTDADLWLSRSVTNRHSNDGGGDASCVLYTAWRLGDSYFSTVWRYGDYYLRSGRWKCESVLLENVLSFCKFPSVDLAIANVI